MEEEDDEQEEQDEQEEEDDQEEEEEEERTAASCPGMEIPFFALLLTLPAHSEAVPRKADGTLAMRAGRSSASSIARSSAPLGALGGRGQDLGTLLGRHQ